MSAPPISRRAILSACAYILQGAGLTVQELAQHMGVSLHAAPMLTLPVVDQRPGPMPELARAKLSEAEVRSVQIHAAKVRGAKAAPPPMGSRTERVKAGKENITFSPPKVPPNEAKPKGEAITTDKTVETRDTTVRQTAKWQTQDLPPDPRWPSFSSMRPGVDPCTGKAWGARA